MQVECYESNPECDPMIPALGCATSDMRGARHA